MKNNKYKRILKNLINSVDYTHAEINSDEDKAIQTECRISFNFATLYLNIINYKELGIDISNKKLQKLVKQIQMENIYPGRVGNYIWISVGYSINSPEDKYNKETGDKLAYISAIKHLYSFIILLINNLYKRYTNVLSELDDDLDYMKVRKEGINNYGKQK